MINLDPARPTGWLVPAGRRTSPSQRRWSKPPTDHRRSRDEETLPWPMPGRTCHGPAASAGSKRSTPSPSIAGRDAPQVIRPTRPRPGDDRSHPCSTTAGASTERPRRTSRPTPRRPRPNGMSATPTPFMLAIMSGRVDATGTYRMGPDPRGRAVANARLRTERQRGRRRPRSALRFARALGRADARRIRRAHRTLAAALERGRPAIPDTSRATKPRTIGAHDRTALKPDSVHPNQSSGGRRPCPTRRYGSGADGTIRIPKCSAIWSLSWASASSPTTTSVLVSAPGGPNSRTLVDWRLGS